MSEPVHIVCPHCQSVNRVPGTRLSDGPKFGQCHTPLFTGQPIALTVADFDVHATRNDIPLVVDFWAPWCGPCRVMAPAFEQVAKILEPHIRLAKVNTKEEQALGVRFGIQSIPTMIVRRETHIRDSDTSVVHRYVTLPKNHQNRRSASGEGDHPSPSSRGSSTQVIWLGRRDLSL